MHASARVDARRRRMLASPVRCRCGRSRSEAVMCGDEDAGRAPSGARGVGDQPTGGAREAGAGWPGDVTPWRRAATPAGARSAARSRWGEETPTATKPCPSPPRPAIGAWLRVIDGDAGLTNARRVASWGSLESPRARATLLAPDACAAVPTPLDGGMAAPALRASSARTISRIVEARTARVRRMGVTLDVPLHPVGSSTWSGLRPCRGRRRVPRFASLRPMSRRRRRHRTTRRGSRPSSTSTCTPSASPRS